MFHASSGVESHTVAQQIPDSWVQPQRNVLPCSLLNCIPTVSSETQHVQATLQSVATCNLEHSAAVQQSCPDFDSQQLENSSQCCRQHAICKFRRQQNMSMCQRHMICQALSRLLICSSRDWHAGASSKRQMAMERRQTKVTSGKERMADTDLAARAAMHLAAGSQHHQSTCGPLACRSV